MAKEIAGKLPTDGKEKIGLYVSSSILKKVKYVEFYEDKTRTAIVDEALNEYIKQWEAKNGPIPISKK